MPRPALDLKARDIRSDRTAVSQSSLTITTLDVAVRIHGGLAETTITAQFSNPNASVLEGDFTLDLAREAYVTGFGLDVNGVMIDGVLQAKAKATEAYEENLRRGVDPGLGEINDANQFRTRIFPINPRSSRTIKITYVSALDATDSYVLPLTTAGPVGQVSLNVETQGNATPRISLPAGLQAGRSNGQGPRAFQGQNVSLRGELKVSGLNQSSDVSVSTSRAGDQYFTFIVPPAPVTAAKPKIIRLYWDTSRSRREDDLAKEIDLAQRYVTQSQAERVDLVFFADGDPRTVILTKANMSTLSAQLRDVRYQGASRFGNLEAAGTGDADICLVFSDGQLTMDAFGVRQWPCRVMTVSSSARPRLDVLEGIAAANRGSFVDLKTLSVADALGALQTRGPDLRALTSSSGVAVDFTISPTATGNFRITGPRPNSEDLVVKTYGADRTFSLNGALVSAHSGAAAVWGISQIRQINATDNPDTEQLLSAVRRYGVAIPDYSYIVLETVEDYARNNIAPSPSTGKDFLARYQAARTQIENQERLAKEQRFATILASWNEQKTWWKTRFNPRPVIPNASNSNQPETRIENQDFQAQTVPPSAPPPPPPAPSSVAPPQRESLPALTQAPDRERAASDASGRLARRDQAPPGEIAPLIPRSSISVTAAAWNPDRPYLVALRQVKSGDATTFDPIYRDQETRFGNTPAFYFDMAEWAHRNGFEARAASIVRNALELPSTSVDTKIITASRLVRYGAFSQAVWLNERILQATPNKPQALRNLALAIIDGADAGRLAGSMAIPEAISRYERALALLMKIVLTPNNGDYDGIELIALMEANHTVAKLKALGMSEARFNALIDPRLVSLLSVDIRVTLEWNTDKTDMDLWVDEPTGERAYFSNPRTAIGGRLSNDMTRGYGPEQYLLKVAPNGTYQVKANAFAADRLDPNGPTSLTVKLYRNWGRPNEKVETFVVEVNRGPSQTVEVGRFVKGPDQSVPAQQVPTRPRPR